MVRLFSGALTLAALLASSGAQAQPLAPQARVGGQDSGGGNLYQGKPLESYIVDPGTLPAFTRLTQQMARLSEGVETRVIAKAVLAKNWYFVPGPLANLTVDQIGSAVPTQQGALQSFDAVWVDSTLFSAMTEDQQATLLLHELVMGFRLYKLSSSRAQCLLYGTLDICGDLPQESAHQPKELNPGDYEAVRKVVRVLLDQPRLTSAKLYALFADQGFGFGRFVFPPEAKIPRPEDLFQAFSTAQLSNLWPSSGYDHPISLEPWIFFHRPEYTPIASDDRCQYTYSKHQDGLGFDLTIRADHREPYGFHVNQFTRGDEGNGGYLFYLDQQGNSLRDPKLPPPLADQVAIGTKVTWLSIDLDRIGDTWGGRYSTEAQLGDIEVYKGVRVDDMGNDAIDESQSIRCSNQNAYFPK